MSASQTWRLESGGRIDRSREIEFTFNGRGYHGHPGDTLASALLANGVRLVGRSFKYHRPRGIVTAGVEEPNALVQLVGTRDEPNVRATTLLLHDGLAARSVNCWPSVEWDLGAINERLSAVFAAGFYYKTFMWPPRSWNFYSWFIRRAAGLGKSPRTPGHKRYEKRFHHCDVLVVGAGPAGLAAALAAARAGARVLIADERNEPGGQLLSSRAEIDARPALEWVKESVAELDAMADVVRLAQATVAGYYDHNLLTILEQNPDRAGLHERLWRVRAKQVVITAGSIERPLIFADNDRPGVMLASAAQAYVNRYAVRPGRRAVLVTNNNSVYAAAADLHASGIEVAAVADVRDELDSSLREEMNALGIEVMPAHGVVEIEGDTSVTAAAIAPLDRPSAARLISCDVVCSSGGWNPTVHLHSQSGGKPVYDSNLACFVPGASVQAERSVGAAAGEFDLAACLRMGFTIGSDAARAAGFQAQAVNAPVASATPGLDIAPCWELPRARPKAKAFVDFQNDVTTDDIRLAQRENFVSVEHVKRYTTAGMGTDQGKLGNANVIGLLAATRQVEPGAVGTTTYRPPFTPISFGAIAGNDLGPLILPSRRTSITEWNEAAGAVMFEAGANYRRPSYYPNAEENAFEAIQREVRMCRAHAGIYDGSPLGKFDLRGPDVVEFLNRVYTNRWDDLPIGRGRFGWMLREDGRLLDDGVTFRLHEDHYWLFCGTGAADHLQAHLERLLQLEWPELKVYLTVVTTQWANICVCGPKVREVLRAAGTDIDLAPERFRFMDMREGKVAGIEARVARVGYTGELSFEINVRARAGLSLWEALLQAGARFAVTPIGSEASMVMRCEKGFISAGYEGDGMVNPYDAGLGWVVDESKPDFVGKRMLARDRNVGGVRPQVVGLLPYVPDFVPADGTLLVDGWLTKRTPRIVGYVSQACFSPSVERAIALAVLDDGRKRIGAKVTIAAMGGHCEAEVTQPCFVDPKGERMRS